jgi:hypothetical protein
MTTDPTPAGPDRSVDTPDPDSLPIDPADVAQKPVDRDRDMEPDSVRDVPKGSRHSRAPVRSIGNVVRG